MLLDNGDIADRRRGRTPNSERISQPGTADRRPYITFPPRARKACCSAVADHRYTCRSSHCTAVSASVTLAQPRATTSPLARAT